MTLAETKKQSYDLLEAVKLTAAAKQRTGAYSGGMRRRLRCVASMHIFCDLKRIWVISLACIISDAFVKRTGDVCLWT